LWFGVDFTKVLQAAFVRIDPKGGGRGSTLSVTQVKN